MALGTPAHQQEFSDANNLASYGPIAVSLTAGRLARISIAWWAALANLSAPTAVTDDGGLNVWTHEQRILADATNRPSLSIWSCIVAATAIVNVTVAFAAAQRGILVSLDEYPGASLAAPVRPDNLASSSGATGTGATSTLPLALAAATDLHVCAVTHQANEATTVGGGFTALASFGVTDGTNSTACRLSIQYKANDLTCDPSWATSSAWALASAELQAAIATAAVEQTPFAPAWLVEVDV